MLGLSVVFSLTIFFVCFSCHSFASTCAGDSQPCTKSYFKVTGADVTTGGWFNNGYTLCDTSTSSNYQDSNFSSATFPPDSQDRYGGILAWANSSGNNSAGGSSGEFDAFALGEIEGNSPAAKGFYSGGAQALASSGNTSKSYLSFANTLSSTPANFWAGLMIPPNGVRQTAYCVPDYYGTMMPNPAPGALPSNTLTSSTASGNYAQTATTTPLDLVGSDAGGSNVDIAPGAHITVFVRGSVYISHNITYDSAYTADNVPKFSLIVQGSIYIGPTVTNLDGLYVAQPQNPADPSALTSDSGDIWTCHDDSTEPMSYVYPATTCNQAKLVVNGALIAKQVELMRTKGDVATATVSEDGYANAISTSNAAEVINYSPAMIMGGSFFTGGSSSNNSSLDGLISLPPIF